MNAPITPMKRSVRRVPVVLAVALGLVCSVAAPSSARPGGGTGGKGISSYQGTGRPESTSAAGRVAWSAEKARTARPALGGAPESVIGADSRVKVNNTAGFPFRAAVLILWDVPGGTASCSGAMIGPHTVATAGHCVAPGDNTGYYATSTYRVYPGVNNDAAPYGGCLASGLFTPINWRVYGNTNFDYGAIRLACNIGNTVGWLGAAIETDAALTGTSLRVIGYPADKPGVSQWTAIGTIGVAATSLLFYDTDTSPGMSGSPGYRYRPPGSAQCVGYCIRAIHTTGVGGVSPPLSTMNHGTRITAPVVTNYLAWINA